MTFNKNKRGDAITASLLFIRFIRYIIMLERGDNDVEN